MLEARRSSTKASLCWSSGCLEWRYRQPPYARDNSGADVKNDEYSFANESTHNSPLAGIST